MKPWDLIKLAEMNKVIIKPNFSNDLHQSNFENVINSLQKVIIDRQEQLYWQHRISIDSLVESQIDLAQRFKKTENLKYWQWVQRKLIKLSRVEEGVTEL